MTLERDDGKRSDSGRRDAQDASGPGDAAAGGRADPPTPAGMPLRERRILGEVHPQGSAAAPRPTGEMVPVWPDLIFRELLAALLVLVILMIVSMVFNAPLEEAADPSHTPNPAKAPWYFVGLQELLTYFDPWIAGVMIPAIIVISLCAIPYIDPTRSGQGVYALRERPLATSIFLVGVVGWFVLIAVGLWFRGPGWSWVWPWAAPSHVVAGDSGSSLPNAIGVPLVIAYFVAGSLWIVRKTRGWPDFTPLRRWTFAILTLAMAGTMIKILLKLVFSIQYIVHFDRAGFNL